MPVVLFAFALLFSYGCSVGEPEQPGAVCLDGEPCGPEPAEDEAVNLSANVDRLSNEVNDECAALGPRFVSEARGRCSRRCAGYGDGCVNDGVPSFSKTSHGVVAGTKPMQYMCSGKLTCNCRIDAEAAAQAVVDREAADAAASRVAADAEAMAELQSKYAPEASQAKNKPPQVMTTRIAVKASASGVDLALVYDDADGPGPHVWEVVRQPTLGKVVGGSAPGSLAYQVEPSRAGMDQVRVRVSDGLDWSTATTVTIMASAN